jgi:hypothetical protein
LPFGEPVSNGLDSAGVCILRQQVQVGELIDALLLIWAASEPDEWRNRIVYLPFR